MDIFDHIALCYYYNKKFFRQNC